MSELRRQAREIAEHIDREWYGAAQGVDWIYSRLVRVDNAARAQLVERDRELREAREEIGRLERAWLPIESAPKDRTKIALRNAENGLRDYGEWCPWPDGGGEWNQELGNGDMTHWQPLGQCESLLARLVRERVSERYHCNACGSICDEILLLRAPSPFDQDDELIACPACKEVNRLELVCDVPGCGALVSCGWPSANGYRQTCGLHFIQAGAAKP